MSDSNNNRRTLNHLVDSGFSAEIPGCFGQSALLRWGEENNSLVGGTNAHFPGLKKENWYMFEIGRNCGTVFSADCVKSIELKGSHAIIHLKG